MLHLIQDNASSLGKILSALPVVAAVVYCMVRLAAVVHGLA